MGTWSNAVLLNVKNIFTNLLRYILLFGTPPFEGLNVKETYNNIKNLKYSFPVIFIP